MKSQYANIWVMKKGERMAKNKPTQEKNSNGSFQWFLFIILPLVFALTITLVILTMAGVDTIGYVKKAASGIPGISSLIQEENAVISAESDQLEQLNKELESKQEEIDQLTTANQMNEKTIEELNQEIVKLNNQLEDETGTAEESTEEQVKSIARSFQEMEAENAAAIVNNLNQDTALQVLKNVPTKERGLILEVMDPAQAANLTSAFINGNEE